MFEYTRALIASTFDHPILASMYIIAGILAVLGAAFEYLLQSALGWPSSVTIGFIGVYAIFIMTIATFGYLVIYLVRLLSKARDRMGPAAG